MNVIGMLIIMALAGCAGGSFSEEYQAAKNSQNVAELERALLALDQKYPEKLRLKTDLAILSLARADLDKARIYLDAGKKLIGQAKKDKSLAYAYWSAEADHAYRTNRAEAALGAVDKALETRQADILGVVFVKARVLVAQDKKREGLALYRESWDGMKDTMAKEDLLLYAGLLADAGDLDAALAVVRFHQEEYGLDIGLGLMESAVLEKLGRVNESLLAAYMELLLRRNLGLIGQKEVMAQLDSVRKKLSSAEWKLEERGQACLAALEKYTMGDFAEAKRLFSTLPIDARLPAYRYLRSISNFMTSRPSIGDIQEFIALEPSYRADPGYYYALWRAMKSGSGQYALDSARPLLEKAALLAPLTPEGKASRAELGRLMGLTAAESEYLLLGPEIDAVLSRFMGTGELAVLIPAIKALAIQNNPYTQAIELMFKALVGNSEVRTYLMELSKGAGGILKVRLDNILLY